MSRINVEDSIWSDQRFKALEIQIGPDMAMGCLVRFWRLAQQYYKNDRQGVPAGVYNLHNFPSELLKVGLAVQKDSYIFADGSDKNFGWIVQKVNASRRGGQATKNKYLAKPEGVPADSPPTPTPTPTPTLNTKKKNKSPSLPVDKNHPLIVLWNKLKHPSQPYVNSISPGSRRGRLLRTRWQENPDLPTWERVVQKAAGSPFLCGQNDRGWVADITFLLGPDKADEILGGKYDNRKPTEPGKHLPPEYLAELNRDDDTPASRQNSEAGISSSDKRTTHTSTLDANKFISQIKQANGRLKTP